MAHSLKRKTVQVSNPQKLIRAVEDKDLNAFKDALNDPLVNVNAYDVAIDSSIFDKILRTPFSMEFIQACAEKGHLNAVRIPKFYLMTTFLMTNYLFLGIFCSAIFVMP